MFNCQKVGNSFPISDETKKKLKERKRKPLSEETKRKISGAHKNRVHTEKARKSMSKGHENCKCHKGEYRFEGARRMREIRLERIKNAKNKQG